MSTPAAKTHVEVTGDDIAYGRAHYSNPCVVFERALRRAGVAGVIVHKGPLKTPIFDARCMPDSMEAATTYYVTVGGVSTALPERCQYVCRAIVYGPSASPLWFTINGVKRPFEWSHIVKPFGFEIELPIAAMPAKSMALELAQAMCEEETTTPDDAEVSFALSH